MPKVNRRFLSLVISVVSIAVLVSCGAIISFKNNLSKSTKIRALNTTAGDISLIEGVLEYPLSLPAGVDSIQVRVVLEDSASQLTIGGLPCASGQWSPSLTIKKGHKLIIPILVSAGSSPGAPENSVTYTLTVDPEKTWSKPEPLVPYSDGVNQVNPQIVENDAGHTVAVWWQQQPSTSIYHLVVSERDENSSWSFPTILSMNNYPSILSMDINEDGEVVIVWVADNTPSICVITGQNGCWDGKNGSIILDNLTKTTEVLHLKGRIDGNGNIIILWTNSNTIFERMFNNEGKCWMEKKAVNDITTFVDARNPEIDIIDAGIGIIVWNQMFGYPFGILLRAYNLNNAQLGETIYRLDDMSSVNIDYPKVACSEGGIGYVVWDEMSKSNISFVTVSLNDPITISSQKVITTGSYGIVYNTCEICATPDETVAATWIERDISKGSTKNYLVGSAYEKGEWNHVYVFSENIWGSFQSSRMNSNKNGSIITTFTEKNENEENSTFLVKNSGAWSPPSLVSRSYGINDWPSVSINNKDEITLIFTQNNGSVNNSSLYYSLYE